MKETRKNRRRPRCAGWFPLRGSFEHAGKAGTNSSGFTGRVGGKTLKPGTHRLVARLANDSATTKPPVAVFNVRK